MTSDFEVISAPPRQRPTSAEYVMSLIRTAALATLVLRAAPVPPPAPAQAPSASLVDGLAITFLTSNYYCEHLDKNATTPTAQWNAAT
jgi:hypothetical protein